MDITEEARRLRNEYHRAWRAKNKDRVRAANQRYWEKRAVEIIRLGSDASRLAKAAAEESFLASIQGTAQGEVEE